MACGGGPQYPRRIAKDITSLQNSWEVDGVEAHVVNNDITRMQAKIRGPIESVFATGEFHLEIKLPLDYPMSPPNIRFITPVYHPSISSVTGVICLDILQKIWSAGISLKSVLISIQVLLDQSNDDDPQDAAVVAIKRSNPEMYRKIALFWTSEYANGSLAKDAGFEEEVRNMMEMGLGRSTVVKVLSANGWNCARAGSAMFDH